MTQEIERLPQLAAPAEILDLPDQQVVEFAVTKWEDGKLFITTRGAPVGRFVRTIRMHVPPEDKPVGAPYWDATAGNLVARLLPMLDMIVRDRRRLRVTKHGVAPSARHQVDVL